MLVNRIIPSFFILEKGFFYYTSILLRMLGNKNIIILRKNNLEVKNTLGGTLTLGRA